MALQTYISNGLPIQIIIGGLDYTNFVRYETISAQNNIIMTSDTLQLKIQFNPGEQIMNAITGNYQTIRRPKCGQEIIWQNPNLMITAPDGTSQPYREFGGVVVEVNEFDMPPQLQYAVQAKDYSHWADRHLVNGFYNQDTAENIIKAIINGYCPSFTSYNVKTTGIQVTPQYFVFQKVSDAIKSIANQLSYAVWIDYYKDWHFVAAESYTAPLPGGTLNADTSTNYGALELIENAEQQYNKVFITGFKTRSANPMILTFTSDGNINQWSTTYPLSTRGNDAAVQIYTSITQYKSDTSFIAGGNPTAGTKMTIKNDMISNSPDNVAAAANNTAYLNYRGALVRVPNFNATGNPPPSGYIVAVRFYYMTDTTFLASDPASQSNTAGIEGPGSDGVYEYAHSDQSLSNATIGAAQSAGQILLMKYRYPQIRGQFTTYMSTTTSQGWRAGQAFTLVSNRRFGGINKRFYVQEVTKTITKNDSNGLITFYQINFADSPFLV